MSTSLLSSLNELANLKQLDKKKIEEIIREGLYIAISRKLNPENELEIKADFVTNKLTACFFKTVVEQDLDLGEISLSEARQLNPSAELNDKIYFEIPITDFEPKTIKNARKAIHERIQKMEEERIIFDYEKQKNQIVSGKIRKIDYNGYLVDIGYADGLLPIEEQVEDEYYKVNDIIKCFVVNIRKRKNDVIVILSRNRAEFVKRIFETEIPEIEAQQIEIKKIVREPGIRTKIALVAVDKNIDPIGCCLGLKGIRLDAIKMELHDEVIDLILWDDSPEQLIANSIGADLVEKVFIADRGNFARIIVTEENKNLAIGKKGKNVKLAAKLTGFKLDIYTQDEFEDKIAEERRITSHITELDGMTPKIADILKVHGYTSVQDIYKASIEELCNLEGVGEKISKKIKESAEYF